MVKVSWSCHHYCDNSCIQNLKLVQYFALSIFAISQMLNCVENCKKNEQLQQADLFKCQKINVSFLICHPNSRKHFSPVRPYEKINCCGVWAISDRASMLFFIKSTFLTISKHFTTHIYCWSYKTLVTIYWMHMRVNGICAQRIILKNIYWCLHISYILILPSYCLTL